MVPNVSWHLLAQLLFKTCYITINRNSVLFIIWGFAYVPFHFYLTNEYVEHPCTTKTLMSRAHSLIFDWKLNNIAFTVFSLILYTLTHHNHVKLTTSFTSMKVTCLFNRSQAARFIVERCGISKSSRVESDTAQSLHVITQIFRGRSHDTQLPGLSSNKRIEC